ncbi:FixH family protein [Thermodesulfobacteriota bacterium B35]
MKNTDQPVNIYPLLILLLIAAFLVFSAWSAHRATSLGSRVTDASYYSKGLKYNSTEVERRAAEVLGWKLDTRLDRRTLIFRLSDRNGHAISGAAGSLYLAIPDAAENVYLPLTETGPGRYQVTLDHTLSGAIQARLELERNGARLNRHLLLNP